MQKAENVIVLQAGQVLRVNLLVHLANMALIVFLHAIAQMARVVIKLTVLVCA